MHSSADLDKIRPRQNHTQGRYLPNGPELPVKRFGSLLLVSPSIALPTTTTDTFRGLLWQLHMRCQAYANTSLPRSQLKALPPTTITTTAVRTGLAYVHMYLPSSLRPGLPASLIDGVTTIGASLHVPLRKTPSCPTPRYCFSMMTAFSNPAASSVWSSPSITLLGKAVMSLYTACTQSGMHGTRLLARVLCGACQCRVCMPVRKGTTVHSSYHNKSPFQEHVLSMRRPARSKVLPTPHITCTRCTRRRL
jgi:hypothetical protein